MKLTIKDQEFLEHLKKLMETKDLSIELRDLGSKYMILRQNYGDKIESVFGMSRQGVRWRFQRLFNDIYVSAYCTIFWIESHFGVELRQMALAIAKEQVALRKEAQKSGEIGKYRLKPTHK
jgi:hypothetical protein